MKIIRDKDNAVTVQSKLKNTLKFNSKKVQSEYNEFKNMFKHKSYKFSAYKNYTSIFPETKGYWVFEAYSKKDCIGVSIQ